MWIVALALRRPYTFVVMALVLIILTPIVVLRIQLIFFPTSTFRFVSVCGTSAGSRPRTWPTHRHNSERGITITVNDIEHIESQGRSPASAS